MCCCGTSPGVQFLASAFWNPGALCGAREIGFGVGLVSDAVAAGEHEVKEGEPAGLPVDTLEVSWVGTGDDAHRDAP